MNSSTFQNLAYIILIYCTLASFSYPENRNGSSDSRENSSYLTTLEQEVIEELNLARSNPQAYAEFLESYSKLFVGRELRERGEITVLTQEGRSVVHEAIRFLRSQRPLPTLSASPGMSKAARDMVGMQESTNQIGHKGRDGSTFADRISRYGIWEGSCSENIDYGNNTARRIVMALIIDDGVSNRGHRKSIFNQGFKRVGVAFGRHRKFNYMCVIELAARYTENQSN